LAETLVSLVVDAPVDDVWACLGDFNGWPRFLPRLLSSELEGGAGAGPVGAVRVITLGDGTSIRERLVDYDASERTLAYEFDGPHPFPVRTYRGRVRLWPVTTTGQTFVTWTGTFDAEAADEARAAEMFSRTYAAFLRSLSEYLARSTQNQTP
jgi:hypothetical protein